MFLLRKGCFLHLLKLGFVLCLSVSILVAFSSWYCDRDRHLNQLPVDAKLTNILRLKNLPWTRQPGSFTWKATSKDNSNKKNMPLSTEASLTVPMGGMHATVVNDIVRQTVDKPTSPYVSSPENHPVKFILIMSYMRSGSSMTSELLQQSEYTFFMFEPFWGVYGENHRRSNVVCNQDLSQNCRNPARFDQSEQGNLIVLEDLFNCRFKHLPNGVLGSFAKFNPNTGYNASNSCFPKRVRHYPRSPYRGIFKSKVKPICLDVLEDMCLRAKVRLIKTIRLPLSFAENILERIPNLKIVHLIRDPRGMINSRAMMKYIKLDHGSAPVKRLCEWMNEDLDEHRQLKSRFSERIILLFYDCLVMDPYQKLKFLFQFLNLEFNQNVVKWIASHMNSDTLYIGKFVKAGNSSEISHSWRTTIKFEIAQMIDRTCENLYEKLGLRKFEDLQDLRNIRNSNLVDSNICNVINE